MELTALTGITPQAAGTSEINKKTDTNATGFDAILQQAMNMVSETNDYQNSADQPRSSLRWENRPAHMNFWSHRKRQM